MNGAALVVAWWFLATSNQRVIYMLGGCHDNDPALVAAAYGPYPTEEICRIAANDAAPHDRRFWDATQRAKWKEYDEKNAQTEAGIKLYDAYMDKLAKQNPKEGRYRLPDGTIFEVYKWQGVSAVSVFPISDIPHPPFYAVSETLEEKMIPFHRGRGNPVPEKLAYDSYTINAPCAPVKGWYTTKEGR